MYLLRKQRILACLAGCAVLALDVSSAPLQFFGFFSVLPVLFYSGKKGRGLKYFFYIFYPAHLLIIGYIAARLPAVLQ